VNIVAKIGAIGFSLAGGVLSFFLGWTCSDFIGWFYTGYYPFLYFFNVFFALLFFVGGFITILGAILHKLEIPSSGIVILIGAILGGINIISLWGGITVIVNNRQRKKDEALMEAEKILSDYLKENHGKAFTAPVLHKNCIEHNKLKVKMNETEKILHDLYLLGRFRLNVKENINYYFVS